MNWSHVRKVNRRASARKAEREKRAAQYLAAIEEMGGEFAIDELRAAEIKVVELKRNGVDITDPHAVWMLRGKEWMLAYDTGNEPFGMMLLTDRFNWQFGRKFVASPFKSAAAKEYARKRTQEVYAAHETAQQ